MLDELAQLKRSNGWTQDNGDTQQYQKNGDGKTEKRDEKLDMDGWVMTKFLAQNQQSKSRGWEQYERN